MIDSYQPPYLKRLYLSVRYGLSPSVRFGKIKSLALDVFYDAIWLIRQSPPLIFSLLKLLVGIILLPVFPFVAIFVWPHRKTTSWTLTEKAVSNLKQGRKWTDGLADLTREIERRAA